MLGCCRVEQVLGLVPGGLATLDLLLQKLCGHCPTPICVRDYG